ncbi:MAG TPA: aspartate carbamoyltransferase [Conexivisphaerales archaeon]|nr:aspartate carbamoyltransferase [Conexivisphaerales archaeon]
MTGAFYRKDIISAKDFTRRSMEELFDEADSVRAKLEGTEMLHDCDGCVLATVFLEPSTRTRLSFQFAMTRLGGQVVDFGLAEAASIAKGETFEDSLRMVDGYGPSVIVVRNREAGSAKLAAEICQAPVVNAGDGSNEHPTQALLDLYTMRRIRGSIDGIRVGMMGDLAHSRTTASLSYALDRFPGVEITYIAPRELQIKDEVCSALGHARLKKVDNYEEVLEGLDFLYLTRLQKERFADPREYDRLKGSYQLDKASLSRYAKVPYILHPLPRVDELSKDVDGLPQAKYFEQAKNGMYVRAALLRQVLKG